MEAFYHGLGQALGQLAAAGIFIVVLFIAFLVFEYKRKR